MIFYTLPGKLLHRPIIERDVQFCKWCRFIPIRFIVKTGIARRGLFQLINKIDDNFRKRKSIPIFKNK